MEVQTSKLIASRIDEQFSPADIAAELNITTEKAIEHIFVVIGDGRIKQSDLFFILATKYAADVEFLDSLSPKSPHGLRMMFKSFIQQGQECMLQTKNSDPDELTLYVSYRNRRVYVGDMYVILTEMESTLHQKIESILRKKYGAADAEWWAKGVPLKVRSSCAVRKEEDDQYFTHAYCYTTLIDLKTILLDDKSLFQSHFPQSVAKDGRAFNAFLDKFNRLNKIRNQVMHPVREKPPTEDDFVFLRKMHSEITNSVWR